MAPLQRIQLLKRTTRRLSITELGALYYERAVREMLLAGVGIALCPEFAVPDAVDAGRLEVVLEGFEAVDPALYVVYPRQRHVPAKVRSFVGFLARHFAGWQASGRAGAPQLGPQPALP